MIYLDSIDVENRKVSLRIDVNLPFNEDGECSNLTGLFRRLSPSLNYLRSKHSAIILLASHQSKMSLHGICKKISEHFKVEIDFASTLDEAKEKCSKLQAGNIIMLENLALLNDEQKCDKNFANKLVLYLIFMFLIHLTKQT